MPRLGSGIPLVARAAEMRRLRAALTRAERGEAGAVLLSGDAGVGKTRVLTELAGLASARGALVLTGRCLDVREGGLPYLPFAEALTPLAASHDAAVADAVAARGALGRLLPQMAAPPDRSEHSTDSSADRDASRSVRTEHDLGQLQLFDAVLGLLTDLAERQPVVLVVEDLHWADGSTRNLVSFLISRLRGQRLLVVASYREEDLYRRHPLRALLAELVRAPAVERVEVRPFSEADVRVFVDLLAEESLAPSVVADVIERSQGNPFFIEELLASREDGSELPAGLAEVLLSRVERLSADSQRVLRMVSVADGSVSHKVLTEVAGLGELELDEALREAVQHHVLVVENGFYAFRHALLQEAVYADLLPGERSRIHHNYAEHLLVDAAHRNRDALLAYHSLQSNDLATALSASKRAADQAEKLGAPAAALGHIEQALRIWDAVPEADRPPGVDELTLLSEASYFAGTSGEPERAIAYARSAVATIDDDMPVIEAANLWRRLAQAMMMLETTWDEAVEAIAHAWKLVKDAESSRGRAWILATRATMQRAIDQPDEAWWSARNAVVDAQAAGSGGAEADALITMGGLAEFGGDTGRARDLLREAQRKAQAAGSLNVELRARFFLALSYDDQADIANALRVYDEGIAYAAMVGLTWSSFGIELRARQLFLRYISGDWPTGDTTGRPLRGVSDAVAARMTASWVHIVVSRGEFADAERLVADLRAQRRADSLIMLGAGAAGAELACWKGDYAIAATRARESIDWLEQIEPWGLGGVRLCALGVSAGAARAVEARQRGDGAALAEATELAKELLRHGRSCVEQGRPRGGSLGLEGQAWLARLEAAAAGLDGPADPKLWADAVDGFGYGAVYEQAMCRWHHAEALLATGVASDADLASAELLAAHEVARRLGAKPLAEAVVGLARRARIELPGEAPERDEVDPFTGRERDVLERVALGRTNRQVGEELYISEKTVSVHLSRVMSKLGASRRAEAVAIAYDRGLLTKP
ncbi:MAG TPA: AAA family ATPase [Mycobacteriales bacterium]|nr:AAA family ATPase [Mycobacteriales bacterium]